MDAAATIAATRVEPRPYQARIVQKALDFFATPAGRSLLLESPTGSGKTVMGLLIAKAMQARHGLRVGWVAMRRYLLAQAQAENRERGIDAAIVPISMFDRDPPANLDMIVVDEAQHDAANSMAHLHNVVRPRFILGLSATPFRADRVKLCFNAVIRDAGIHQLISDGYLSRYAHYTLPAYTPAAVAEAYLREPARWGKAIVYFHTLRDCHAAATLLREGGVRCEVVTGGSAKDEQLTAFHAGAVDVLLNCMVLCEGFDCPALQTVFCRPASRGPTVQMAGRVLRRHAAFPLKQVVQCQHTRWPFGRTAAAAEQRVWQHGEWRSLQPNARIDQVQQRTLLALARTECELPAFILKQTGVRGAGRGVREDPVPFPTS